MAAAIMQGMKVLLIEDDPMIAKSVSRLLERGGDVEVVHCAEVASALDAVDSQDFDLIVSDWSLGPVEKSEVVLRAAMARQPQVRRVLMSGEAEAARLQEIGVADAFYLKDSKLVQSLRDEIEALDSAQVAL
jgi:DNA-binding NtrC family response regulator